MMELMEIDGDEWHEEKKHIPELISRVALHANLWQVL